MATRTITVDDLDGHSEADETLVYSLQGQFYEVDLTAANVEQFREALQPYIEVSRPLSVKDATRRIRTQQQPTPAPQEDPTGDAAAAPEAIRAWATEHDISVNERGRLPREVVERYRQAHQSQGS